MEFECVGGLWRRADFTDSYPVLAMPPGEVPSRTTCVWCGHEFYTQTWEQSCELMRLHQQACPDNLPLIGERKKVAALQEDIDRLRAKRSKQK